MFILRISCGIALLLASLGCSRARVESMNLMNEGVELAQQRQYSLAVDRLERAGSMDPSNDQVFWNLAIVHMEMQKFSAARDDLQKAIAINPKVAGYHEKLGTVQIELKDYAGARQALEKSISLDPGLFKAYYKLAQVLEQLDDEQNALRRYTEAIEKGPRFLEAYAALGRLYADLDYLDQAVQVFSGALQVAQKDTEEEANIHHLLGTVYQQQNKYPDALREFKEALRIAPGKQDALFSLGWTYALVNERDEAKRYLKKYVDVAGSQAPPHYVKAARDKLAELSGGF
jgi:tetratricopeptide (TPR) repeat protein